MVGCFISLFVREDVKQRFKEITASKVKMGMKGKAGNKGAVGLSFQVDDSTFLFLNCHLASGHMNSKVRAEQIQDLQLKES